MQAFSQQPWRKRGGRRILHYAGNGRKRESKKHRGKEKAGQKAGKCSICGQTIRQSIKKIPATISVKKSITLKVKKSTTIKVKYQKGDGIKSWISNNKKIVTVSKSGKVIGKKKGKAVIKIFCGGKTAKVKVTVK